MGNPTLRKVMVYTPAGYDAQGSIAYPVVYLLPGLPFTEKSFVSKNEWDAWVGNTSLFKTYPDFPTEGFREWIDGLISSEAIEPMILVMPNVVNNNFCFSWYTNSQLNGKFKDYIVYDLVNYIDNEYKTMQGRNSRAVIGFSQGAYAAVKFGMLHADIFGVIAGHSGLLYLDGILTMGPVVAAENPEGFAGPDSTKFLTFSMYAMSAAWSPNLTNPPYMVDLPFKWPDGEVIYGVRTRWLEHDVFTLLSTYENDFKSLNGIYLDCGALDELGMTQLVQAFTSKMNALGVVYTYEEYQRGHLDRMFSRLEKSLAFCSEKMY